MSDNIIEQIVNIKEEIDTILQDRVIKSETEMENNAESTEKIISVKGIIDYLSNYFTLEDAQNYYTKDEIEQTLTAKNYVTNDGLENYATKDYLEDYATNDILEERLSDVTTNFEGHSFKHPQKITDTVNNIIEPGYYLFEGDGSFQCAPYMVNYKNGLIRVEKQGNHLIQYVHSTSEDRHQLDGREYIRHGYLTNNTSGDTVTNWDDWKVHYFPYQNKDDDLLDKKGENVDDNAFHVYESTAGYTFEWKQKSTNAKYVLPMNQYTYVDVYILKKELPIPQPMIFSNFIGHIDIKVVNEPNENGETVTKIKVRSSSNKGEYIVGVDNTYFVPRIN